MIPKEQARQIISSTTGEKVEYKIAAVGKAFRALMDGMYERKIEALVRELCSNAYDAHVQAGKAEVPFFISAPGVMAPEFSIRDYGKSMEHEFVMNLYSTLFFSSKDDNNDEVGMFGLGSKSPFAYTDAFNVKTFRNGVANAYLCCIDNKDVPSITHLGQSETSEPDGTLIYMSVPSKDVPEFKSCIEKVIFPYEVKPRIDGFDYEPPVEISSVLNVTAWDDPAQALAYGAPRLFLDQGSVLYPVPHGNSLFEYLKLSGATKRKLVIKVPLGTFDVTPSRESISMNEATMASLKAVSDRLKADLLDWIKDAYRDCKNTYEYLKEQHRLSSLCLDQKLISFQATIPGSGMADFRLGLVPQHLVKNSRISKAIHDPHTKPVEGLLWDYGNKWMPADVIFFDTIRNIKIWVGLEDEKIPRRTVRFKAAKLAEPNGRHYLIFSKDLPRFVRLMGLKPDQVALISSMPDEGNQTAAKTTKVLSTCDYYVSGVRNKTSDETWVADSIDQNLLRQRILDALREYDQAIGTTLWSEFNHMKWQMLSPTAVKKLKKPELNLGVWLDSKLIHLDKWAKWKKTSGDAQALAYRNALQSYFERKLKDADAEVTTWLRSIGTQIIATETKVNFNRYLPPSNYSHILKHFREAYDNYSPQAETLYLDEISAILDPYEIFNLKTRKQLLQVKFNKEPECNTLSLPIPSASTTKQMATATA